MVFCSPINLYNVVEMLPVDREETVGKQYNCVEVKTFIGFGMFWTSYNSDSLGFWYFSNASQRERENQKSNWFEMILIQINYETLFWRDLIVHETFLKGVRVSEILFSACKFNISNLYIVIYL